MAATTPESLISQFVFERLLIQDQAGRRIVLLGHISTQPALLLAERAAFSNDPTHLTRFPTSLSDIKNLGDNDVYHWYLACTSNSDHTNPQTQAQQKPPPQKQPADLKLNLIYPCTDVHIRKYSPQQIRSVTETAQIYARHVRPFIQSKRDQGRLNWVFNILDGRTEQENVLYRSPSTTTTASGDGAKQVKEEKEGREEGGGEGKSFLLLPDLNWDRETIGSLHLLALVQRRDIWSVRDLKKRDVRWLREMVGELTRVVEGLYQGRVEGDMLKFYVHYQPTYYHFHIHIVHVGLEAGATQAVGKAISLHNVISQLETMAGDENAGMADVELTYTLGEASELWTEVFGPLKEGRLGSV